MYVHLGVCAVTARLNPSDVTGDGGGEEKLVVLQAGVLFKLLHLPQLRRSQSDQAWSVGRVSSSAAVYSHSAAQVSLGPLESTKKYIHLSGMIALSRAFVRLFRLPMSSSVVILTGMSSEVLAGW